MQSDRAETTKIVSVLLPQDGHKYMAFSPTVGEKTLTTAIGLGNSNGFSEIGQRALSVALAHAENKTTSPWWLHNEARPVMITGSILMARFEWLFLSAALLLAQMSTVVYAATTSQNVDITVTHNASGSSDLRVSANRHYLEMADGTPFFFLSDTEWVLNGRTDGEVTTILDDRAAKGFSVVQVFSTRAWEPTDVNGNLPFINNDPTQPNLPYWNRWRWIADRASERGLHLMLVYGEPGRGDAPWTCSNGAACYEYGRRVGDLFKDKSNVIFCAGQDSHASENQAIWRAIAEGTADGVNGVNDFNGSADYSTITMTYHGYDTELLQFDSWLDFYGAEVWGNIAGIYDDVNFRYNLANPAEPSMLIEGDYEGYPYPDVFVNPYWTRVQAFHVFFAGGAGYAYGNKDNYMPPATTSLNYLASGGADGMRVFSAFMRARNWWKMVPDQAIIVSGAGSGVGRQAAVQSTDGNECLVYYPTISSATIDMGCITATNSVAALWFDPRNGNTRNAGTFARTQHPTLQPPAGWEDAVLDMKAM